MPETKMHAYQNGGQRPRQEQRQQEPRPQGIPYTPPPGTEHATHNQASTEFDVIGKAPGRRVLGVLIAVIFGFFTFCLLLAFIDELGRAFGDPSEFLWAMLVTLAITVSGVRLSRNGKSLGTGHLSITGQKVAFNIPESKKSAIRYETTLQALQTVSLGESVDVTAVRMRSDRGYVRGFGFVTDDDGRQRIADAFRSVGATDKVWKQ